MRMNLISHLEDCIDVFEAGGEDGPIRIVKPLFTRI